MLVIAKKINIYLKNANNTAINKKTSVRNLYSVQSLLYLDDMKINSIKKTIVLVLIILPFFSDAQIKDKIFYDDFVECYFDNSSLDSLIIYDSIDGKQITSLKIKKGSERLKWYKIAIKETKNGWAKIESIMIVPGGSPLNGELKIYKNNWIKLENLKINIADMSLPDSLGIPFYSEANLNSEVITKSGKFLQLTLIETHEFWAKVSFTKNGIKYIAWIERKNQCAYPWTSCPYSP